jgi:spore germination cell wall hydrolase CwlJ-like protein
MRRRMSRRMWYVIAALVPLPVIGLGYFAVAFGNQFTFQLELLLTGHGSSHAQTAKTDADKAAKPLPAKSAHLFARGGKGPRADQYTTLLASSSDGDKKPGIIAASLAGGGVTGAVSHSKSDRMVPRIDHLALRGTMDDYGVTPELFNGAPFRTTFRNPLEVYDGMVQDLVYKPQGDAAKSSYQGESEAEFQERQRRCLATAIYFEARGEPVRGQLAVAQVIMNRVRSPRFPDTICGVVYQGQHRRGCQFSFTCDGRSDTPRNDASWALSQDLARQVTSGQVWLEEVGYSTFYHANYVNPRWSRAMNRSDVIGQHIFYKKRNEQPYVVEAAARPGDAASLPSLGSTPILKPGIGVGTFADLQPEPAATQIAETEEAAPAPRPVATPAVATSEPVNATPVAVAAPASSPAPGASGEGVASSLGSTIGSSIFSLVSSSGGSSSTPSTLGPSLGFSGNE